MVQINRQALLELSSETGKSSKKNHFQKQASSQHLITFWVAYISTPSSSTNRHWTTKRTSNCTFYKCHCSWRQLPPPTRNSAKMKQKFGSFDKGSETTVLTDLSIAMETPRVCPARRRSSLALARERTNGSRRSSAVSSRRGSSVSGVSEGGAKPRKEAVTLNYYVEDKSTLDTLHLKAADVSSHQVTSLHIVTHFSMKIKLHAI